MPMRSVIFAAALLVIPAAAQAAPCGSLAMASAEQATTDFSAAKKAAKKAKKAKQPKVEYMRAAPSK